MVDNRPYFRVDYFKDYNFPVGKSILFGPSECNVDIGWSCNAGLVWLTNHFGHVDCVLSRDLPLLEMYRVCRAYLVVDGVDYFLFEGLRSYTGSGDPLGYRF